MIRYLIPDAVYYSLNDVTNWLLHEGVLTKDQSSSFNFRCRAYVAKKLAIAYQEQYVDEYVEPIILPLNDYFIHWIVWANLLMLLPTEAGKHPKVDFINLLLDDVEMISVQTERQNGIELVCLNDKLKLDMCK
ncbi:hypothetical protein [Spirosoma flavum]|uniref:Uncharacterized protein n=1 Tax=Spirosoma flavum TaxID=2048557 RepID=A0ABW6AKH0_9BACT